MSKRTIAGLGVATLIGTGLLFGGASAASAATCPAGQVWVTGAGSMNGFCMTPASGGGTGGNISTSGGTDVSAPIGAAPQAPTGGSGAPIIGGGGGTYVPPAPPVQAPAPVQHTVPSQAQDAPGQQVRQYTPSQGYVPGDSNPAARAGVGDSGTGDSTGDTSGTDTGTAPVSDPGTSPAPSQTQSAAPASPSAVAVAAAQQQAKVAAVKTAATQAAKVFALRAAAVAAAQAAVQNR